MKEVYSILSDIAFNEATKNGLSSETDAWLGISARFLQRKKEISKKEKGRYPSIQVKTKIVARYATTKI